MVPTPGYVSDILLFHLLLTEIVIIRRGKFLPLLHSPPTLVPVVARTIQLRESNVVRLIKYRLYESKSKDECLVVLSRDLYCAPANIKKSS